MKKFFKILILTLIILSNTYFVTFALSNINNSSLEPRWDNTSEVYCELYFYGNTGYATATIKGKSGTVNIDGVLSLYKKSGIKWVLVEEWEKSTSGTVLAFSESFSGINGTTYKIEFSADVTRNNTVESVSSNHQNTCI